MAMVNATSYLTMTKSELIKSVKVNVSNAKEFSSLKKEDNISLSPKKPDTGFFFKNPFRR